ncbi:MAG: hypothetical protein WCC21_02240 [Candidatus Acidiferrales bacterium]
MTESPINLTNAHIIVGNSSNQGADVAMSGDVTISNTGVTTIKANVGLAGSPTTTTQPPGDNSTKVATTAYADAAAGNKTTTLFSDYTVHASTDKAGNPETLWTYTLPANTLANDGDSIVITIAGYCQSAATRSIFFDIEIGTTPFALNGYTASPATLTQDTDGGMYQVLEIVRTGANSGCCAGFVNLATSLGDAQGQAAPGVAFDWTVNNVFNFVSYVSTSDIGNGFFQSQFARIDIIVRS